MSRNMQHSVSLVIPVFNGAEYLRQCLDAILASDCRPLEIIVVDDGSTDASYQIAIERGAAVLQLPSRSGPAAARNYGATKAKGEILFFIDADVAIKRDAIGRVIEHLATHPEHAAVFGSYDDDPPAQNFISQYKNLFHHFVHQQSNMEAFTFWAGCGAVRMEAFKAAAGFDHNRYPRPSIEDIELGYRMKEMGYRIALDNQLQAKHLKRWTIRTFLRSDILDRAIPWSVLILEHKHMPKDLNLRLTDKLSAAFACLSVSMFLFFPRKPWTLVASLLLMLLILLMNKRLYTFYLYRKGASFALSAFFDHVFYYLYCTMALVLGLIRSGLISAREAKVAYHA